jgi:D-galactarolactone cycloisomerase
MRIARVRAHVLEAKLSEPFGWSFNATDTRGSCLVEIVAEDGTTGWGECYGPARLNAPVVRAMASELIGKDPLATDALWLHLYNKFRDSGQKGLVVNAISGIDIALWDLKGRHFETPVHVLMGGPLRREVRAYATGTYRLRSGDRTLRRRRLTLVVRRERPPQRVDRRQRGVVRERGQPAIRAVD